MAALPDAWILVMNDLLEAPAAWRSPAEIAAAIGRSDEELTDLLCDLDVAGWLSVWEGESGPLVTLSALAAQRLSVRLVEVGLSETPRWARIGDPDPPAIRSKNVCLSERAASLEFVADGAIPPDLAAERGERAEAHAGSVPETPPREGRREEPPRPSILLGLNLTPWPGPRDESRSICPACGDRTLGPQMYCLYCDRWGLDRLTTDDSPGPPAPGSAVPQPRRVRPAPNTATVDQVQTERLRAGRKRKRQARYQAKLDADRRRSPKPQPPAPKNEPGTPFVPLHSPPPGMPRTQTRGR